MPNVALLPVTQNPDQLLTYVEENFRRIAATFMLPVQPAEIVSLPASKITAGTFIAGVLIPASQVTAGTFNTGDFIFPGILTVNSFFKAKARSYFSDGLELAQVSSTPYIDFHRSSNPEEATDFDVRLINDANGNLSLVANGGLPTFRATQAQMSYYKWDSSWAHFGHRDRMDVSAGSYQYLAHSNGRILINSSNGQNIDFARDGAVIGAIWVDGYNANTWLRIGGVNGLYLKDYGGGIFMQDATWVRTYGSKRFHVNSGSSPSIDVTGQITMNQAQIRFYNESDSNHIATYNASVNGPLIGGWANVRLRSVQADANVDLQSDGNCVLYDNGSAWGMKNIPSAAHLKIEVDTYTDDAMVKIRKMRPIRFKRKYNDRRITLEEEIAQVKNKMTILGMEKSQSLEELEYKLAFAEYKWDTRYSPEAQRFELGFIAEELNEVEPGVVAEATDMSPMGIMYGQLTALLTKGLQELDARLIELEKGKEKK
jgi:hypothetical protein